MLAGRRVVGPHPLDHVEHFLGIPRPKAEPNERAARRSLAGSDIIIDCQSGPPVRLNRENREAFLLHQISKDTVLHLEELGRTVTTLAERDDSCVTDDSV